MNKTELIAVLVPIILLARIFFVSNAKSQLSGAVYVALSAMSMMAMFSTETEVIAYTILSIILIGLISLRNLENITEHEND